VALAGTMAWLALVLFAIMVIQAIRREPRMKQLLAG
jgi:Na+/serine symporter